MTTLKRALSVLEDWRVRRVTVLCVGSLFGWNFNLRGEVASLSGGKLTLVSPEGVGELILELKMPGLRFDEGRIGDVPNSSWFPKTAKEARGLTLSLPLRAPLSLMAGA